FCNDDAKNLRLLAPAGSGKTQAILWRCLRLNEKAQQQNSACRSLIFTFTRVARDELHDRINTEPQLRAIAGTVEINTLNAWGWRLLKNRLENPRLLTSTRDRSFLVKNDLQPIWQKYEHIKDLLTDGRRKVRIQNDLMGHIDSLKGLGFRHDKHGDIDSFMEHIEWLSDAGLGSHVFGFLKWLSDIELIEKGELNEMLRHAFERFMPFWADAVEHLHNIAKLSLEDQKYWALIELEKMLKEGKYTTGLSRYHHIMVDEFQDINALDLNLLMAIAQINKTELTVIGDDDQAIYEWRGASPDFILKPEEFIAPEYRTHILDVNYRCPKNVVAHSQRLIRNNEKRVNKTVHAASEDQAQIEVEETSSIDETINYVVSLVKELLPRDDVKSIALISRKRSQLIPYQIVFAGDDTPFYAAEDLNVMLSGAFKDLKELLILKAQYRQSRPLAPDPVVSLLKLCDKVERFPLSKAVGAQVMSFVRRQHPKNLLEAVNAFSAYTGPLTKSDNRDGRKTAEFHEAIVRFLAAETVSGSILMLSLFFEGLSKDYGKSQEDIFYADPPFLYLSAYAERYGSDIVSFYEDVEKAIDTLAQVPSDDVEDAEQEWKRKLHLMTALRAKGKEFDVVIILDCNQGIWPSKLAETPEQLEAERRVFYVAFTRAKKCIKILVTRQMLGRLMSPSPYIMEMGLQNS
ncbi:MAG: ATP-dependent helicase, partial [Ottowia sp.]|nr:ATP-dependent helicase [Ottowia sp.]